MTENSNKENLKLKITAVVNAILFAAVAAVYLRMFFRSGNGAMSATGFSSLKYFTVLSNLFEGIASLVTAVSLCRTLAGKSKGPGRGAYLAKLSAAACVTVTFLVVVVFLGPLFGYGSMYKGANLWFHLIIPLAAFAEFVLAEHFGRISFKETILSVAPLLLYGIVYLINVLVNGPGEWPHRNDFYGFTLWGLPIGICIFALILLIGWAAALALRALNKAADPGRGGKE